jgi:hypothetical protein
MSLSDDEVTGGKGLQLSNDGDEGAPLVSMESYRQTKKILDRIQRVRYAQDVDQGFMRDFPDWSSRLPSWMESVFSEVGKLNRILLKLEDGDLASQIEQTAATVIAWREALMRRDDESRVSAFRWPWYRRIWFKLTRRDR